MWTHISGVSGVHTQRNKASQMFQVCLHSCVCSALANLFLHKHHYFILLYGSPFFCYSDLLLLYFPLFSTPLHQGLRFQCMSLWGTATLRM